MRLANVEINGRLRAAVLVGDELIDLTAQLGIEPPDVPKFLATGAETRAMLQRCARESTQRHPIATVRFRPAACCDKILGVGMNYNSFVAAAQRLGMPVSKDRIWFFRPRSCITGPYDDVWLPSRATDFDYEAELAIVIGRQCRYVTVAGARSVVAGYTVANDLTLRERARRSLVLAKSFDTHTPVGPWVVTPDEIEDPHALNIKTWVNGELRQSSNTADMIVHCDELICEISSACTLNPGDIILTGTPGGCGVFHTPPKMLAAGDVVKIEIEGIGMIENRVVDEPAPPVLEQ